MEKQYLGYIVFVLNQQDKPEGILLENQLEGFKFLMEVRRGAWFNYHLPKIQDEERWLANITFGLDLPH